jgi:hypothetical protein
MRSIINSNMLNLAVTREELLWRFWCLPDTNNIDLRTRYIRSATKLSQMEARPSGIQGTRCKIQQILNRPLRAGT